MIQEDVRQKMRGAIALIVMVGFLGVVAAVFLFPVPDKSRDLVHVLIGALGVGWTTVLGFYFGSSQRAEEASKDIREKLKKVEAKAPHAPPPLPRP